MALSLPRLVDENPVFRTHESVGEQIKAACSKHDDVASFQELGASEEGRMIYGVRLGTGEARVSLIAGNHADEPVGPETLRCFVLNALARRGEMEPWLRRFEFVIVPHTNPDGEARNRRWIDAWPDLKSYLLHAVREKPGRDLEYGYPSMRPENEHVSTFLRVHGPFSMHASLHGMSASEGALLLINRPWTFRTQELRDAFTEAAAEEGMRMHDHNRKGEKGFFWIEPGFQTTPRGDAMRTFFRAQNDPETASQFYDSSMEFVMSLGGDPLALVTEIPLFLVENANPTPGRPDKYLELRERLPEIKARLQRQESVDDLLEDFSIEPVSVATGIKLQLRALELGLETVASAR